MPRFGQQAAACSCCNVLADGPRADGGGLPLVAWAVQQGHSRGCAAEGRCVAAAPVGCCVLRLHSARWKGHRAARLPCVPATLQRWTRENQPCLLPAVYGGRLWFDCVHVPSGNGTLEACPTVVGWWAGRGREKRLGQGAQQAWPVRPASTELRQNGISACKVIATLNTGHKFKGTVACAAPAALPECGVGALQRRGALLRQRHQPAALQVCSLWQRSVGWGEGGRP